MKLKDLTPDRRNANRGTKRGQKMLSDSLRAYGAGRSILIDKHGAVIAGNKTLIAAGVLSSDEVLVVKTTGKQIVAVQRTDLDLATDPAAMELAIADNRVAEIDLDWSAEALAALGREGADLEPFFSSEELAGFYRANEERQLERPEDDVPDLPLDPVTKPGDLIKLGPHMLLCGVATDLAAVKRLMGKAKADLLLTDPPYNVDYESRTGLKSRKILNDNQTSASFRQFLRDSFGNANGAMRAGACFYIWHADTESYNFRGACQDIGWKIRECLVWVKQSLVLGRQDYQWKHEPCLHGWTNGHEPCIYGWKEGEGHLWTSDRKQTTVLEFDRPSRSAEHPTMKPVALFEYLMLNNTQPGNIVLDCFAGSGTTLIAAQKWERQARLLELDPRYCDVIVNRWQDATGEKAKRP